MSALYKIDQQSNGQWYVTMLDGGHIEFVYGCPSEKEASAAALFALAKNREYKEEECTSSTSP